MDKLKLEEKLWEKKEKEKIVDTLRGIGKLRKGDQIVAEASYVILVIKEIITIITIDTFGSPPKQVEGMGEIKGTFMPINPEPRVKPDETYTLELSDGRKIDLRTPSMVVPNRNIDLFIIKAEGFK